MKSGVLIATGLFLLLSYSKSFASDLISSRNADKQKLVYIFNIKENIAPAIWRQTKQAFDEANRLKADLFLIHMNTYGGTVVDADSIRTRILNSKIRCNGHLWCF